MDSTNVSAGIDALYASMALTRLFTEIHSKVSGHYIDLLNPEFICTLTRKLAGEYKLSEKARAMMENTGDNTSRAREEFMDLEKRFDMDEKGEFPHPQELADYIFDGAFKGIETASSHGIAIGFGLGDKLYNYLDEWEEARVINPKGLKNGNYSDDGKKVDVRGLCFLHKSIEYKTREIMRVGVREPASRYEHAMRALLGRSPYEVAQWKLRDIEEHEVRHIIERFVGTAEREIHCFSETQAYLYAGRNLLGITEDINHKERLVARWVEDIDMELRNREGLGDLKSERRKQMQQFEFCSDIITVMKKTRRILPGVLKSMERVPEIGKLDAYKVLSFVFTIIPEPEETLKTLELIRDYAKSIS